MAQKIMRNGSDPIEIQVEIGNVNGLSTTLNNKVEKIQGKGLSQNDYSNSEKSENSANTAARHAHSNFVILNSITQDLISKWNNAFSHISDAVMHITASERNLWNTVSNKGDMAKGVYDTNNNGKVDDAEKVNGLTVLTAVPSGAQFTDTIYTHPSTHPYSMLTGAPTSLPANGGNAATLDGKTSSEIQNYNNLTNKPIIPVGVEVTNNLTSSSTSSSLSANMGRELNSKKMNRIISSVSAPVGQEVGDRWEQVLQ